MIYKPIKQGVIMENCQICNTPTNKKECSIVLCSNFCYAKFYSH